MHAMLKEEEEASRKFMYSRNIFVSSLTHNHICATYYSTNKIQGLCCATTESWTLSKICNILISIIIATQPLIMSMSVSLGGK